MTCRYLSWSFLFWYGKDDGCLKQNHGSFRAWKQLGITGITKEPKSVYILLFSTIEVVNIFLLAQPKVCCNYGLSCGPPRFILPWLWRSVLPAARHGFPALSCSLSRLPRLAPACRNKILQWYPIFFSSCIYSNIFINASRVRDRIGPSAGIHIQVPPHKAYRRIRDALPKIWKEREREAWGRKICCLKWFS